MNFTRTYKNKKSSLCRIIGANCAFWILLSKGTIGYGSVKHAAQACVSFQACLCCCRHINQYDLMRFWWSDAITICKKKKSSLNFLSYYYHFDMQEGKFSLKAVSFNCLITRNAVIHHKVTVWRNYYIVICVCVKLCKWMLFFLIQASTLSEHASWDTCDACIILDLAKKNLI